MNRRSLSVHLYSILVYRVFGSFKIYFEIETNVTPQIKRQYYLLKILFKDFYATVNPITPTEIQIYHLQIF